MGWFGNLKIQYKLLCSFGLLVSLMFTLTILAVSLLDSLEANYAQLMSFYTKRQTYLADAIRELGKIRFINLSMMINFSNGDPPEDNAVAGQIFHVQTAQAGYTESLIKNLREFRSEVNADGKLSEAEKQQKLHLVNKLENVFTHEYQIRLRDIDAARRDKDRDKLMLALSTGLSVGNALSDALEELRDIAFATAARRMHTTTEDIAKVHDFLYIVIVCMLLFSVFVSVVMAKTINAPIAKMKMAMTEISNGNLAYPIRSSQKDELGMLSNHIGDMVDSILEMNKTMAVMDYLDTMICVCDFDYNLLYINRRLADACGVDRKTCMNQKCYKVIRKRDAPCAVCQLPKLLPNRDMFPSLACKDIWDDFFGVWLGGRAGIIRWVDGSKTFFHAFHDETQKKNYEEQLHQAVLDAKAASIAKSAFLANMSHEIRTPMNSIIGFSELALGDAILPNTREYLGKILESSTWLLQIINNILDISKIESGKMELERIPFNLHELVDTCQTAVIPKALEKGIMLHFDVEPSIGKTLLGDPTRLRQALLNMLFNAVKFTNVGTVKFTVLEKSSTPGASTIHFEIQDSGIGMTPEQIATIAEPFAQAESGITRKYGGTGLGLPITTNIISMMGGELAVESTPGVGSEFSFDLTFSKLDLPVHMPDHQTAAGQMAKPVFAGEVLLCEDNKQNQQVLCEHLARVGLKTLVAENGKEGVERVQNRMRLGEAPFDLIFMDIQMPVMDGLEAAAKIMALGTGIPIVAMTANIMSHDRERYRQSGIQDCLGKPFTLQELWCCLLQYFTPVSWQAVNETRRAQGDAALQYKLMKGFVRANQSKCSEIVKAIEVNDRKLARRLVHTLKGNAGLLGQTRLQEAAGDVERLLEDAKHPVPPAHMGVLDAALRAALKEFGALLDESAPHQATARPTAFNAQRARELLEIVAPLLDSGNPECLQYIDDLRVIPGSEKLILQMEDFDFEPALATLAALQKEWV